MPRAPRVHFEGAMFHVYNHLVRGERIFADDNWAGYFVKLLAEVAERDELKVFAWCLLPNHFHALIQVSRVPLDRPIRSVQHRLALSYNRRHKVRGPLWRARYGAKLVESLESWQRVVAYVHLNPVAAGMVEDPADHPWSGHNEILGRRRGQAVVDIDEVLRLYGDTRRSARASYVRWLKGAREEPWLGEDPGRLPWWRRGRPILTAKEDEEDPQTAVDDRRVERPRIDDRRHFDADDFVRRAAAALGVTVEDLAASGRQSHVVRARELIAVLGGERYGVKIKDIAALVGKRPASVSGWVMRGTNRRLGDGGEFRAQLDELDAKLSPDRD